MKNTCYMCDMPSTSKEHVPPKCLFPSASDVPGAWRKELITVPSCHEHNNGKSADDEFLLASLAGIVGCNSIGFAHKFTRVNRAIRRTNYALLNQALSDQKWGAVHLGEGNFIDIVWGKPDYQRLGSCFDKIARGLYHHTRGHRFRGEVKIYPCYAHGGSDDGGEFRRFIRDRIALEQHDLPRLGANPQVFSYQFLPTDEFGIDGVQMVFYGGLDVFAALIPDGTEVPFNLGVELMNRGMPTVLTLGEKEYRFNRPNNAMKT